MAKKDKNKNRNKKKKNTNNSKVIEKNYNGEENRVIITIVIVIIVFIAVYFLTTYITKTSTDSVIKKKVDNTTYQSSEILVGTSFKQKESEYLVLFYDEKSDVDSTIYNLRSDYEAKEGHLPIYYVDLGNKLNESCISNEDNQNATHATELKINTTTLIQFKEGKISKYMVGEEISEFLNK